MIELVAYAVFAWMLIGALPASRIKEGTDFNRLRKTTHVMLIPWYILVIPFLPFIFARMYIESKGWDEKAEKFLQNTLDKLFFKQD